MDFFDEHRFTENEAKCAHTLITMKIGSMTQNKYNNGVCYVCRKLIPTKECTYCHHGICDECAFECANCHNIVCKLCLHDNDESASICYKCAP